MSLARQFDDYHEWRDQLDRQVMRLRDWLRDADLLDNQAEQRLRHVRERLAEDRLIVAFVAEFSRGKSELINALFFADRGGRVLPSAAGRTTMCPTEISWEKGQSPGIALLPIETRAEGASITELRGMSEAWQTFPFDPALPESMAPALRRVGDVKNMAADAARALGFAIGDGADGSLVADRDGMVEVPRWRHAMIRFPHPLLAQGLVVLDTPGLNAIGAEPELTLSLLPGAHAVLFVLAADTGVTQSDLTVWREHVGNCPGRMVVLNKVDGLWDGLRPDWEIEAEIASQARSCAQILGLPVSQVFPVSAQKGLLAKVNGDAGLLARSKLARLEQALATELLAGKQEIVAGSTATEALRLAAETRQLLTTRRAAIATQLDELTGLRGKHESVIAHTVTKVGAEKEAFERGLREYYAVRSVFSQLSEKLFSHLGPERLRSHSRQARNAMAHASFTPQLTAAMNTLIVSARANIEASEKCVAEIADMMRAMHEKFGGQYGFALEPPPPFSLQHGLAQIDQLQEGFRRHFGSLLNLMTRDKHTLTQQFFETIATQLRRLFEQCNHDADQWLRVMMAPLETQVRELQRQLKQRQDSIRRIHETADSLEDRIDELSANLGALESRLRELDDLTRDLAATASSP
jgi:hypothetical protein